MSGSVPTLAATLREAADAVIGDAMTKNVSRAAVAPHTQESLGSAAVAAVLTALGRMTSEARFREALAAYRGAYHQCHDSPAASQEAGLEAAASVLTAPLLGEIAELRDKALRFDLDQAGIEARERDSIALVESRAEVERLRQTLALLERNCTRYATRVGDYLDDLVHAAARERALKRALADATAQREAAYEQAAVWCVERAERMDERARRMDPTDRRDRLETAASWVRGCADTIRNNAKLLAAAPTEEG